MAMHHAILTQHLVQTMGQPQQLQQHHNHHQLATGGVSPRQRTLIRRYHGAMHREQTGHVKSSSEMMRQEGVESPTDGSTNYLHHTKGNQRGRASPGPSHRGYHEMHLNPVADGSIAGKSHHDNGSRNGDDKANLDEGPQVDGKRVKRQHKFYSKMGNVPGNMSVLGSPCYGAGQCYSPSDARAVAYQQGLHVHKRRFQADSRPFAFHSQRGRKMGGGGVGPMLDAGLSSVIKYPLPVSHVPNAPERFLSRAHLVNVKSPPTNLCSGGEWDKLSEGIWDKFFSNQQSEETFIKKMLLWKCLYVLIKNTFPRYGLYLVGSTMSGFGSDSSDVDMCLLVRYSEMDQRNEAVGHLEQILHYLNQCDFIDSVELIQAKVPILKFRDSRHGLEVDLNCNNSVGIRNTHLLYCYSQMDWRVRPLVLVVKLWAHKHNINDAKNMTISSYSLTLMVINFLQCGVSPPVLPCLHSMYLGKFSPHLDLHRINLMEEMAPYNSENTMALGELFLGFLRYYSLDFDFTQEAVSVRLASRISIEDCRRVRSYKNDPHQWKFLCIEEPFDLTNTARSVYDKDVFERVKHVFRSSYLKLNDHKTIDCLFED